MVIRRRQRRRLKQFVLESVPQMMRRLNLQQSGGGFRRRRQQHQSDRLWRLQQHIPNPVFHNFKNVQNLFQRYIKMSKRFVPTAKSPLM
jgi:hypothetical protein